MQYVCHKIINVLIITISFYMIDDSFKDITTTVVSIKYNINDNDSHSARHQEILCECRPKTLHATITQT